MSNTLEGSALAAINIKKELQAWLAANGFEWKVNATTGTLCYGDLIESLQKGDTLTKVDAVPASQGGTVVVTSHHPAEVNCSTITTEGTLAVTLTKVTTDYGVFVAGVTLTLTGASGKVDGLTVTYADGTGVAVIVPTSTFWDDLATDDVVIVSVCGKVAVVAKGGDA